MASTIPYIMVTKAVLTASGQGNLSYTVSQQWVWHAHEIFFIPTGAFQINQITDSNGTAYTNATQTTPIASTMLQDPRNAFLSLRNFIGELQLAGGLTLNILIQDTSAAPNTVTMVVNGQVDLP